MPVDVIGNTSVTTVTSGKYKGWFAMPVLYINPLDIHITEMNRRVNWLNKNNIEWRYGYNFDFIFKYELDVVSYKLRWI